LLLSSLKKNKLTVTMPCVEGIYEQVARLLVDVVSLLVDTELTSNPIKRIKESLDSLKHNHAPRGINTLPLLEAARTLNIPFYRRGGNYYQFGQGRKQCWFDSSCTEHTPAIALQVFKNKIFSKSILIQCGLPVANGGAVRNADHAVQSAKELGFPVVIKPTDRDRGLGVFCLIDDESTLRQSYEKALAESKSIMIESYCPGNDYRLHVMNGKVYRARQRTPGGVTGDGVRNINDLLTELNSDPRRSHDRLSSDLKIIPLDFEAEYMLTRQGLTADSIPEKGKFVQLRTTANVSTGGITEALPLEKIHPENLAMAERAVTALNLDLAAVDFLCTDISQSWIDVGGVICEVNGMPQFGEDAPKSVLQEYLPDGGLIPSCLVVGNLPSQLLNSINQQLDSKGLNLGYADDSGTIRVNSNRIAVRAPYKCFEAGKLLISQRNVDAIILKADHLLIQLGCFSPVIDCLFLQHSDEALSSPGLVQSLAKMSKSIVITEKEQQLLSLIPEHDLPKVELIAEKNVETKLVELLHTPH